MRIISKRELIRSVAESWREEYCFGGKWRYENEKELYEQLLALGEDATEEQIIDIINIRSWTANKCSECGRDVDLVVHFGEEPDYDAVWADVCLVCLRKAEQLMVEGMEHEYLERPDGYTPGTELTRL